MSRIMLDLSEAKLRKTRKSQVNYSIDTNVVGQFGKYCNDNEYSRSIIIEKLISRFLKESEKDV